MKENLYMVYDNESQIGLKPIVISKNDVGPVREIQEVVNDEKSLLHKHAGDFELLHIGEIDLETLIITPAEHPHRTVARLYDLLDDK